MLISVMLLLGFVSLGFVGGRQTRKAQPRRSDVAWLAVELRLPDAA